jgi:hypothetical protein
MNARQHTGRILAAAFAGKVQIAAASEGHAFALRLLEGCQIDADRVAPIRKSSVL